MIRCSDCGTGLEPDEPDGERRPCPNCGSLVRTFEESATATVELTVSAKESIERGVNEARMETFALIVGTALSVGLAVGFSTGPLVGVLAGIGGGLVMVAMLAVIHRVPAVRHVVMELMHRITGQ